MTKSNGSTADDAQHGVGRTARRARVAFDVIKATTFIVDQDHSTIILHGLSCPTDPDHRSDRRKMP